MLNSTQIKKIKGKKWQTSFAPNDIENIFDECGAFNGLFYSSQFSLAWFIKQIFNDKHGKPLELMEFQQVALDMLWNKKFPLLLMTRGGGKSFLLAIYAFIRALLVPGSKIVIVSSSFRQAKFVFKYIEELYDASPIIQESIGHQGGPKYGSDTAYLKVGLSTISALPIGTGDTIRGQRASVLLVDEIASVPEQIFDIILSPFTAVHANPAEKARIAKFIKKLIELGANEELIQLIRNSQDFGNQIVMSGTTAFKYNHLYRRYQTYRSFIRSKGDIKNLKKDLEDLALTTSGKANQLKDDDLSKMVRTWKHYAIMQLPYTALPEDFLDEDSIRKDKASFPEYRFRMEYLVEFSDDSDGFIKRTWIDRATPKPPLDLVPVELYGNPKATYVMGLDPARWNDNFGCVVLKITARGKELVYCTAWDRTEHHISAKKIREVCRRFNIQYIAMDKGGGGDTVRDELCRNVDGVEEMDLIWTIPEQLNNPADLGAPGRKILELVDFGNSWISEAAHGVEADIEKCSLLFPYNANENDIYQQYITHFKIDKITQHEKDQLNIDLWGLDEWEASMLSSDAKKKIEPKLGVLDNINECLNETCAIKRNVTPKGVESFDLPNLADQPEGLDMRRRDRWTALMLANYAAKVHMGHGHTPKNTIGGARRGGYIGRGTRRRGSAAW